MAKAVISEHGRYFRKLRRQLQKEPEAEGHGNKQMVLFEKDDERVMMANEFMKDDEFIKSQEFKSFLVKLKQKSLRQELAIEEQNTEKNEQIVQTLQDYDPETE